MIELLKQMSPSGDIMTVAEILTEENEIAADAVWTPSNDTFAHKVVRRLSRPTGTWRKINKGVAVEAPRTIEAWETLGMLESFGHADEALVKNSPNPRQTLSNLYRPFIEGMGEHWVDTLIYGSTEDSPEEFTGLAPRMNALDTNGNVLDGGGSGSDCTSVFVVCWGPNKVHMAYPMNDAPNVGVTMEDLGRDIVSDAVSSNKHTTSQYMAYRAHFKIQGGLVVEDPRCIGRVANIETAGSSNLFDEDDLITLLYRMPKRGAGAHIYVNETILTQMHIALKDKNNVNYTSDGGEGLAGAPVIRFMGYPVRLVEAIVNTESAIS
jgi:hypothetical protein